MLAAKAFLACVLLAATAATASAAEPKPAENPFEKALEEGAERAVENAFDRAMEKALEKAADRAVKAFLDEAVDEAVRRALVKMLGKAAEETKPGEKAAEKPIEQPAGRDADAKAAVGKIAEKTEQAGPLRLAIEVYPDKEVMPYDPIYVRLILANAGKESVFAQTGSGCQLVRIEFLNEKTGRSRRYPEPREYCCMDFPGGPLSYVLLSGEAWTVFCSNANALESGGTRWLCVRPPAAAGAAFWRELGDEVRIRASISTQWCPVRILPNAEGGGGRLADLSGFPKVPAPYREPVELSVLSPVLRIKSRPAAEMKLLGERFGPPAPEADKVGGPDGGWEEPLRLNETWPDTPAARKALEERFSPGTYRNRLQFDRMLWTIREEPDEARGVAAVRELSQWLDTLPELECWALASGCQPDMERVIANPKLSGAEDFAADRQSRYKAKPSVIFELHYAIADRIVPRYQLRAKRRDYLLQCYHAYGALFREFLKAKGEHVWKGQRYDGD